jgi:hypothetical protein
MKRAWVSQALCRSEGVNPDWWFDSRYKRVAKSLCSICPVAAECLEEGIQLKEEFGIRAGLTPKQFRRLSSNTSHEQEHLLDAVF